MEKRLSNFNPVLLKTSEPLLFNAGYLPRGTLTIKFMNRFRKEMYTSLYFLLFNRQLSTIARPFLSLFSETVPGVQQLKASYLLKPEAN